MGWRKTRGTPNSGEELHPRLATGGSGTMPESIQPASFEPWTPLHWVVIAVTMAAALGLALRRRSLGGTPVGVSMDWVLAATAGIAWLFFNGWQLLRFPGSLAHVLPLHISDLLLLLVAFALALRWRWARALVYFLGLGLGPLVYIMPDLEAGPARPQFWIFWLGHLLIMVAVAYDIIGRGFRPTWRDWYSAVGLGLAYAAVIVPLNAWTGYSYGYLGPDYPGQPALLVRFGSWPLRVIPILSTAFLVMAALVLPWKLAEAKRATKRSRE